MTFTEADLANLKAALISGATKVQIGDRLIEYRSQKDLLSAIDMIEKYLASLDEETANTDSPNVIVAGYSKGQV